MKWSNNIQEFESKCFTRKYEETWQIAHLLKLSKICQSESLIKYFSANVDCESFEKAKANRQYSTPGIKHDI